MGLKWRARANRLRIVWLLLLPALFSCQREPSPLAGSLPMESVGDLDRRELVLRPKEAWIPESAPLKLKLLLISEKNEIPPLGRFRYRIETRNVGRKPVVFREPAPSFIKEGSLCGAYGYRFIVTPPGEDERPMPCEPSAVSTVTHPGLDLTLVSGDYLLTGREGPSSRFRDLRTAFKFAKSGAYRVKVVYAVPGLRAESNTVVLTVTKSANVGRQRAERTPQRERPSPMEKNHE